MWRALVLTLSLSIFASATPVEAQPEFVRSHSVRSSRANSDPCRPLREPAKGDCYRARLAHQAAVNLWWAEVRAEQRRQRDWNRLLAHLAAQQRTGYGYVHGVKVCDGPGMVPCRIVHRESRFNPTARNPRSSAGGLYQLLRFWLPWCGLGGYSNAAEVPVSDQVACSRRIVARYGLAPWRL